MNLKPYLTLVGAGPGDPELITIKAVRALQQADVVLYDALANEELLNYAPERAIKIFVGKRVGLKKYTQDEINELIVEKALLHGHVVRLKGGDPFVFGRGFEELMYAADAGIPGTIVPGISSALSVPAYNGIPITHRELSRSFWVVTGTNSQRELTKDVALAAQSSATVVILMGINKLAEIVSLYRQYRGQETPVAIIQNGTLSNQKMVVGNLNTIENQVRQAEISSPAIIMIGEVVQLAEAYQHASYQKVTLNKAV